MNNENKKPTQAERVLAYMERNGAITQWEALMELGIMRLASRISEIQSKRGVTIESRFVPVYNRHGEKCHVKEYRIAEVQ